MFECIKHACNLGALLAQTLDISAYMDKKFPKTVEEAVYAIIEQMNAEDRFYIANMKEDELISLHFTAGMQIRNNFGLWEKNDALLKDTGEEHPDDASGVILKALWEVLRANKGKNLSEVDINGLEF